MIFTDCFKHMNVSVLDFLMNEILERESLVINSAKLSLWNWEMLSKFGTQFPLLYDDDMVLKMSSISNLLFHDIGCTFA